MWHQIMRLCLGALTITSCKKTPAEPSENVSTTTPSLISTDNAGKDEDPSLLATPGKLFIAWFSERSQQQHLFVRSSTDNGKTWGPTNRITTVETGHFYPSLFLDSKGALHAVWFRWVQLFVGQIRHATSTDGVTWTLPEPVTVQFLVDDWVPSITEAKDGTLLVYFVSQKRDLALGLNQIYLAAKAPGAAQWTTPVAVPGVNGGAKSNHLPYATRIGDEVALVWVRNDPPSLTPWLAPVPKSDVFFATSPDGKSFSNASQVTKEGAGIANVFPYLYQRHDNSWWLVWQSTRRGGAKVFEIAVAGLSNYPTGVVEDAWMPSGYSHKIVRTTTPNEYLAAWVQGIDPTQDIYAMTLTR